ncbi:MAG: ABC transporter permease subunit [Spirochaetaceae bacterium]|nr:ABC transporter permease subunit [Spirochaetaceae bacterium]
MAQWSGLAFLRRWWPPLVLALLFVLSVSRFDLLETALGPLLRRKTVFAARERLGVLALQHLGLVAATGAASFLAAFPLAVAAARREAGALRDLLLGAASFAETFPTVALMALLVPAVGYGFLPVGIALFLYGLLPVFRNTLVGLESTPPELVEAALGCGMNEGELLRLVRLPVAAPLVLEGLRVSLVVNIAAGAVGAAVGAGGLGVPIVSGLRAFDPVLILEGALPLALLALAADSFLRALEAGLAGRGSGRAGRQTRDSRKGAKHP